MGGYRAEIRPHNRRETVSHQGGRPSNPVLEEAGGKQGGRVTGRGRTKASFFTKDNTGSRKKSTNP